MNSEDIADLIDELRQIKKAIQSLANPDTISGPGIGDNVLKSAKSILVCKTCNSQLEISSICQNSVPIYKCPQCGLQRTIGKTAIWVEYEQVFKYGKVKII